MSYLSVLTALRSVAGQVSIPEAKGFPSISRVLLEILTREGSASPNTGIDALLAAVLVGMSVSSLRPGPGLLTKTGFIFDLSAVDCGGVGLSFDSLVTNYSAAQTIEISLNGLTNCPFVRFPVLTSLQNGGDFIDVESSDIATFSCPVLTTMVVPASGGGIFLFDNANLTNVDFPVLQTCGEFDLFNCDALTTLSLPQLVTAGFFFVGDNAALTSVSLPNWVPTDGASYWFFDCALNVTSVNAILVACAATMTTGGNIRLEGGTSAAPTGAGAAAKATLIANGVTVTTN